MFFEYDGSDLSAEPLVNEFGAFRCAPSSTPTPSRSTNSPPNQPPRPASANPMIESRLAVVEGCSGRLYLIPQLPTKSSRTRTFVNPCIKPILLARVPDGIAAQSISPNGAAITPPMIPAAIIQYETVAIVGLPQII